MINGFIIDRVRYKDFSYLEILKNYEGVLESFGAQVKGKDFSTDQSLYFYFPVRGDGKEIYGKIGAYNGGTYTIHFLIPNRKKER